MYCRNCGAQLGSNVSYCPTCGVAVAQNQPQQPPVVNVYGTPTTGYTYIRKNKWVAFFLCFLFGVFGIHRFYVGKIGTGMLWLLTGGLLGFGALIDLIVILCGGFRDKAGQPLA